MSLDHDTLPAAFDWVFFVFMKISKNRMAASNEPPGDACHRTHLWVFPYEPRDDSACSARQRELV